MRVTFALALFLVSACNAEDDIDKLVDKIRTTRTVQEMPMLPDKSADGTFDHRIVRALTELFDSTKESKHSELRWHISFQLLNAKDPNPQYFLEIEKEMKWVLSLDVPPLPFSADTPDQPSEFRNWCGSQVPPLLPDNCYQNYILKPMRLFLSAQFSADPRFVPLFRQGLSSKHEAIWLVCAVGLGMSNDRESLPMVAQKIVSARNPMRATVLLSWSDPLADQLALDIAKSDEKALSMIRTSIAKRDEKKRKLPK